MAADTTKMVGTIRTKFNVVAGAAANTNMAITGIKTTDVLQFVCAVKDPASTTTTPLIDVSATTSITSNGNIQSTTDLSATNLQVIVIWQDVSD